MHRACRGLPQVLCINTLPSSLEFYGIPNCGNKCVSGSVSVSCAFSWALFVLFYSYVLDLYDPLEACLFLIRDRKGVDPDGWEVGRNWKE